MSCYHPRRLLYRGINPDTGKRSYQFDWFPGYHQTTSELNSPEDVLVPCRKCIGCRLEYSRSWADRLVLELDHTEKALFLTLTYDNDHVTPAMFDDNTGEFWYTLVKKDLQDFNKRLRYYFPNTEIRFFAAGEYGDLTLRPHYHGIYFGIDKTSFPDIKFDKFSKTNQPIYHSDKLDSIWKNGYVSIQNVSWQSCAYVARYSLKKLKHGSENPCISRNCLEEFSLMSRRPGIGGYFHLDHPEIFDNPTDKIFIADKYGMKNYNEVNMPSYIFDKLELVNPELYAKIKEERLELSNDRFLTELAQTDLDEFEYQKVKERTHEKRAKTLIRPL